MWAPPILGPHISDLSHVPCVTETGVLPAVRLNCPAMKLVHTGDMTESKFKYRQTLLATGFKVNKLNYTSVLLQDSSLVAF